MVGSSGWHPTPGCSGFVASSLGYLSAGKLPVQTRDNFLKCSTILGSTVLGLLKYRGLMKVDLNLQSDLKMIFFYAF